MKKYKKTTVGALILLLLFLASYFYPLYAPLDFNKAILVTDEKGNYIGRAPFPPSGEHLLGTDRNGQDMHLLLLYGAKFTLLTAIVVALLRVFAGGIAGVFLSLYTPYLKKYFKDFFIIFRYIPSAFIGIVLMMPVMGSFESPRDSVVMYQIFVLVFLGFPSVTIFSSEITDGLVKHSFVRSSYLMGASKLHMIRTHLMPYFRSYGLLFTFQQLLSSLQVTMHLGIFGYFLGGETIGGIFRYDEPPKSASLSNEWAGLIGQNFNDFIQAPWTIFGPIIAFLVVILIVNMMKNEVEQNINGTTGLKKKREKPEAPAPSLSTITKNSFEFVRFESIHQGVSLVEVREKKLSFFDNKGWVWVFAVLFLGVMVVGHGKVEQVTEKETVKSTEKSPENTSKMFTSNPVSTDEATEPVMKKGHTVGEEIHLTTSTLIVTKVEKLKGNSKEKPKPGNEYVIVTVQIKNIGKENVEYGPNFFDVLNSKGESFLQPFLMIDIATTLPSGELAAGESITGTLAFEMPINEPLQLRYLPYKSMTRTIIDLQ